MHAESEIRREAPATQKNWGDVAGEREESDRHFRAAGIHTAGVGHPRRKGPNGSRPPVSKLGACLRIHLYCD